MSAHEFSCQILTHWLYVESPIDDCKDVTDFVDSVSLQKNPKLKIYRKNTRLLDAVEDGDVNRVSRLLKLDANPNATCTMNFVSACHIAAMKNNDSLSMLMKAGAQSFRTDELGRTPLHLASWAGLSKQIAVLLDLPEHLQNKVEPKMSPKTEVEIKTYCSDRNSLINIPCGAKMIERSENWSDSMEHNCAQFNKNIPLIQPGWTPLHLASARAHYSCVMLLLAAGANPCVQDYFGITPLDVVGAALYSGFNIDDQDFKETIIVLLAAGGKINNALKVVQSTFNTPLHTAVELKSEEAIKELLKAGASPTCLNINGLTALHICVYKRLREHLQLITNFEYSDPVDQASQVTLIDTEDKNGLTVLHTAVKAKWIDGVRIALGAGANIFKQAKDGNSSFHYAATTGDITIFQLLFTFAKNFIDIVNLKGQTAIFIAIANNHLDIVQLLAENGSSFVNTTHSDDNVNVLHVAAEHGHKEILNFLLNFDVSKTASMVNAIRLKDRRSPIFYASVNNNLHCVQQLLDKGAQVDLLLPFKDSICEETDTTVLHVAAANNYTDLASMLLRYDSQLINKHNTAGLLPLHEACIHRNKDVISLFIHNGADLSAKHPKMNTSIGMIMNILPKPTDYMQEIFDTCITICDSNIQDNECSVTLDYKVLLPSGLEGQEIKILKALVNTGNRYNQKRLLHHPLIESFLYLKWKSLLPFFYVIIALYGWFVLSFNMYVMSLFYDLDRYKTDSDPPILFNTYIWKIMTYVASGYVTMQTIILKIITEKSYFSILDTWVNLLASILAMTLPSLVSVCDSQSELMRGVATIAVLLSWIEMMFLVCSFPNWGFYVLMFGKVTVKVCKVLSTFGFLIIGFAICFMIQFQGQHPFDTLSAAITKTLVMMTSEYDYSSTVSDKYFGKHVKMLRFIFVVFVILASIVLMNLLIAVAVNDVNNLEEIGNQRRLEKQVDFLSSVESFTNFIKKAFGKSYYNTDIFTNDRTITLRSHQPSCKYCKILPVKIREAIFEKVRLQKKQVADELGSLELKKKIDELQCALVKQDEKLEQLSKFMKKVHDHFESRFS